MKVGELYRTAFTGGWVDASDTYVDVPRDSLFIWLGEVQTDLWGKCWMWLYGDTKLYSNEGVVAQKLLRKVRYHEQRL